MNQAVDTGAVYRAKLAEALERAGDLYSVDDILERIDDGRMQAHVSRETVAVTEISVYPKRRVLTIILLAGDLADGEDLHRQVLEFAHRVEVDAIVTQGRDGWAQLAKDHGWEIVSKNMTFRKAMRLRVEPGGRASPLDEVRP